MSEHDYPQVGVFYYWFVTKFSDPDTNSTYPWGYGWNFKRPYSPLTDVEKSLVVKMYGETQDKLFSKLDTPNFKLVRNSIKTGFSLNPLNQAEKNAYNYFKQNFDAVSVIEYAQWGAWNNSTKELNIKINSCEHLIRFTFNQKDESDFKVDNKCQLK
jgi:hypothetical protein